MRMPPRQFRLPAGGSLHRSDDYLFEALLLCVDKAVVAFAPDGRLTHANSHTAELIGRDCPIGTHHDDWFRSLQPRTASGRPMVDEDLPVVRALQGECVRDIDVLVSRADGDVLLTTGARPVRDRRGRLRGALMLLEDVTEQRWVEARLRQ